MPDAIDAALASPRRPATRRRALASSASSANRRPARSTTGHSPAGHAGGRPPSRSDSARRCAASSSVRSLTSRSRARRRRARSGTPRTRAAAPASHRCLESRSRIRHRRRETATAPGSAETSRSSSPMSVLAGSTILYGLARRAPRNQDASTLRPPHRRPHGAVDAANRASSQHVRRRRLRYFSVSIRYCRKARASDPRNLRETQANRTWVEILLCDDEESLCRSLGRILRSAGHDVVAVDGPGGYARMRQERFDLILTDIRMPGVNGFEILAAARTHAPGTPVIAMSGSAEIPDAVRAMHAGARDFLIKPFEMRSARRGGRRVLKPPPPEPAPPDRDRLARSATRRGCSATIRRCCRCCSLLSQVADTALHGAHHRRVGHGQGAGRRARCTRARRARRSRSSR